MLVLSREKDEEIVIGDDITIMVVEIRGNKVRLGITAPKEILIFRREVLQRITDLSETPEIPYNTGGMLVLSRKKEESIVIGDNITIVVVEIRGDKVRLGIEADSSIPVHRREVYDAIQRSQKEKKKAREEGHERSD